MGYSYGTANQAFDPHSELDDISHGSFQVNGATLKVTTSSEEEEEEDSVTPRQEQIKLRVSFTNCLKQICYINFKFGTNM